MRTFVALNLPADERDRLHAALAPLRDRALPIRWVAADALHLTMKFLGEIEGTELNRIDDAVRGVAAKHAPIELRISGFGAFPAIRRASIVWVGVQPDRELMALQRDLELAMSRLGYAREQKPFRPHITVGRTRGEARPPDMERHAGELRYDTKVRVETIDIMRSHLGAGGSRYEALLRRELGAKTETEMDR